MRVFKTPKEWARAFLLITGTCILAGLYFLPLTATLETAKFDYLVECRDKFELIYMMLVTFYLKEKVQDYLEQKTVSKKTKEAK